MTRFTKKGRSEKEKALALVLYVSGVSMNRIGQIIGVTAQSVMRWIRAFAGEYKHSIDQELKKTHIRETEVDELCHYIKKNSVKYGYGKYMIVPLSDVSPGSVAIVPLKPFKS
jgi:transposase-like protein